MKYMRVTCIECKKPAEEMIQIENEIIICEWCYGNIQDGITKIINEEQNKFK